MTFRASFAILISTFCLLCSARGDLDFYETFPNGERPAPATGDTDWATNFPGAAVQPSGPLSGRIVFTAGGHGWTWSEKRWFTQRGVGNEMNEDYGNLDQMNWFVPYAFNAGATVVTLRPVGYQTNEVVLDNESRGVTFKGAWFKSTSDIYFGEPGAVPYRFASLSPTESATAIFTPGIPESGFYPVYTWVRHGADRTSQLYRIQHTGGQTLVRIPHHMVGNGWVYLGTYHFNKGTNRDRGSVVISSLQPSPGFGSVVVADAIRFGNGMGDVVAAEGASVSSYPREEEAARYWVQRSFGQGQTNFFATNSTDHQSGNVSAPNRMAKEMNRETEGNLFKRIYLGFHSNAGGGRGVVALWNNPALFPGSKTPNQERYADLIGREVNDTLAQMSSPPLEVPWFHRTRLTYARNDYPFGEINDRAIEGEFDATILEVAFHDSKDDAKLLRDPKVRDILGRTSYQAIVRYMNEFDDAPLHFLPEPPQNVRAQATDARITVSWDEPADIDRNPVDAYYVYQSENGYGFGQPIRVPATRQSLQIPGVKGKGIFFRVTAANAGGESLPSAVVGCKPARKQDHPKVLFVNGFTQLDRANNPRQTIAATNYVPPGAFGEMDRVIPRLNNAFDYVVQHGTALSRNKIGFDSCERTAIAHGIIRLDDYEAVIWAAGRQKINVLESTEDTLLAEYIDKGGNVFFSGAHLAENLSHGSARALAFVCSDCPNPAVTAFDATPVAQSIFRGNRPLTFGTSGKTSYFVASVNALGATSSESRETLLYPEGFGAAAVLYDGSAVGRGKAVVFGFPFETITTASMRAEYLADILDFFELEHRKLAITPRLSWSESGTQLIWISEPGRSYQVEARENQHSAVWRKVGIPVTSSGLTATLTNAEVNPHHEYRVVLLR